MYKIAAILLTLLVPHATFAAVYINEIAWMGSSDNANAEWIELYNDGTESVPLSGWTLTSSGTAPNITIQSGKSIPGNGFFLLERTSDQSAAPVADQIYTGALSNSGDTLTLKDQTGTTVDLISGGSNWSAIGGDNSTKHTPQRNGSSWITAVPTPKAVNATSGSTSEETATTTTPTATSTPTVTIGGTTPASQPADSPVNKLYLDAGKDRTVPAQMPTPFRAVAYTKGGTISKNATITWNFGDGTRENGKEVLHTFRHPGEYAVIVRARSGEATTLQALKVVVEAYDITARVTPDGVILKNASSKLVDLSSWELVEEEVMFSIPEDTALWPGAEIVFAPDVTGLPQESEVLLRYPSGKTAHVAEEEVEELEEEVVVEEEVEVVPIVQPAPPPVRYQSVKAEPEPTRNTEIYEESVTAPTEPELQAAVGAAMPALSVRPSWLMCLFGNLLACGATFVVP